MIKSPIDIHKSSPSWNSLPPPIHHTILGCHRALVWAPRDIQQSPTGYVGEGGTDGESMETCTFSSVQSLSHVWIFVSPWTAAHQASLSITNSWSLVKSISIESVMPSNHVILRRPLLLLPSIFPSIRVFSNESVLRIRWPKYWSFSFTSVLPMNIQEWFPLELTDLISLLSKGLSRVFCCC